MRFALIALPVILLATAARADSQPEKAAGQQTEQRDRPSGPLQQKLAPGLARYTDDVLFGEVWPGQDVTQRDRSLVAISVLIATNKPRLLRGHLGRALDNGVTPVEASGVLTQLAFYAGWPNAVSALETYDQVYTARDVDFDALQIDDPALPSEAATRALTPPLDDTAPDFVELTDRVVVDDLWRRSDLSFRDRSLVTIAALAAMGEAEQLAPYLGRAVAAGMTRDDIAQALTHLAFYAGWGKASAGLRSVDRTLGDGPQTDASSGDEGMQIWREGAPPVRSGPEENFSGPVQVLAPFQGTGASRLRGATVAFEAGARSAWHRHPLGQALIVTEGCGWTQTEDGPIEEICEGDVVWIGAGEKHWHGATADTAMSHVAVSESIPDESVEWLEKVPDEVYARGPR